MNYLLDVNVLVAWGWYEHADHARVGKWIAAMRRDKSAVLLTSAVPQLGFVRVSVHRSRGAVTPVEAGMILNGMLNQLGSQHRFIPDDLDALTWAPWCKKADRTTDAHLLQLAKSHRAALATLDEHIPGAFVIPR